MDPPSTGAVVCREVFDENSQPSAEEISDYAQQIGIDPESESHLLPLAREGLMTALPPPWKAYYDEKLSTHYYYNEDTKSTQWEHPLDNMYRELVQKARDASMHDDTCASVQDLPTFEENTKHIERAETKIESDDDGMSTDSEQPSGIKDNPTFGLNSRRLTPLGRPPLAPISRPDKKLSDLRISPLMKSVDGSYSPKLSGVRNFTDKGLAIGKLRERPKLFKQQSEIIDLKMHVLTSPEEEHYNLFSSSGQGDKGIPITGKGGMFLKLKKTDLPSPDTEKSLPLDSISKSDPPKGILREKASDSINKTLSISATKTKTTASSEEDRKSVRFNLENPLADATISPGSNSSSDINEGQSSIISAPPSIPLPVSSTHSVTLSPLKSPPVPLNKYPTVPNVVPNFPLQLSPLVTRPPLPPKLNPLDKSGSMELKSGSEKEKVTDNPEPFGTSPKRRLLRPPAVEYINPDLFTKNFKKIADIVKPSDFGSGYSTQNNAEEPQSLEKEGRPRSPMIPQTNKISINLMESIESETSIDSPDKEFASLDLNDMDDVKNEDKVEENEFHHQYNSSNENKKLSPREFSDEKITTSMNSKDKSDKDSLDSHISKGLYHLDCQSKIQRKSSDSFSEEPSQHKIDSRNDSTSENVDISKNVEMKLSLHLSPSYNLSPDLRSHRSDTVDHSVGGISPLSSFKPVGTNVLETRNSDSNNSLNKNLCSPKLGGVIISQGKSFNRDSDNVVVMYQFEQTRPENGNVKIAKNNIHSAETISEKEVIDKNKVDERKKLESLLQNELEELRSEWAAKEKRLKKEMQEEIQDKEKRFLEEKKMPLIELSIRQNKELEEAIKEGERLHKIALEEAARDREMRYNREIENMEKEYSEKILKLREEHSKKLEKERKELESEAERSISELRESLQANLHKERTRILEEHHQLLETMREEQTARVTDLRHDYRAEVERLRNQHACHLEELRARMASERAAASRRGAVVEDHALADKYKCLKEKYARLKHDVKLSIERRNKRREMSMTTGSETEKSNSHKATQSLERCKELNETLVTVNVEAEPRRARVNNNPVIKYNDNETSLSESNAPKSYDNNNADWKGRTDHMALSPETSQTSAAQPPQPQRARGRVAVAFRVPPPQPRPPSRRRRDRDKQRDAGATTDYQDSSDATTAEDKPKDALNGHGRRRCFTRLKSASTSRLNYSPKRGEGWSSPLESLRQQLRKLDDLEDQFPDLVLQPPYSLRYPFAEIGAVPSADTPELEFVRHRALVEREGMRRARAVLRRRRAALRESRASVSPHRAPSEERETTELEVALHRARALLGEKEIRLRHIERALRRFAETHPPPPAIVQEVATSDGSSGSEAEVAASSSDAAASGVVLRSLRALHADVRDIWLALDASRPIIVSPETSSCHTASAPQARMPVSPHESTRAEPSDGGVAERARGLRAWLQTAP